MHNTSGAEDKIQYTKHMHEDILLKLTQSCETSHLHKENQSFQV